MKGYGGGFEIEYDGGTPPLPRLLKRELLPLRRTGLVERLLPAGTYLLRFMPLIAQPDEKAFDLRSALGVLRVEHGSSLPFDPVDREIWPLGRYRHWTRGSGDLYSATQIVTPRTARDAWLPQGEGEEQRFSKLVEALRTEPREMLVQPQADHRFYLRLSELRVHRADPTDTPAAARQLSVELECYRYDPRLTRWVQLAQISFRLADRRLSASSSSGLVTYAGLRVRNRRLSIIAALDLAQLSADSYRQSSARMIDLTGDTPPAPEMEGVASIVEGMFSRSGIALRCQLDPTDYFAAGPAAGAGQPGGGEELPPPPVIAPGRVWTREPLLGALEWIRRGRLRQDRGWGEAWEYLVLLVPKLQDETRRFREMSGLMFDERGRRGCAVALDALGGGQGDRARIVAHELGHCMGLYHDPLRPGLMAGDPTAVIPALGGPPDDFSALDRARLKHLPDSWSRPDGLRFGQRYTQSAIEIMDLAPRISGLTLTVDSVRFRWKEQIEVSFTLRNDGSEDVDVPDRASIARREAQHLVRCKLVDPEGRSETLGNPEPPWWVDGSLKRLGPAGVERYAVPFEFGGFLFPPFGWYEVEIGLAWVDNVAPHGDPANPNPPRLSLRRVVGARDLLVPQTHLG